MVYKMDTQLLDIFNQKLLEFVADLIDVCPEIKTLKKFKLSVSMTILAKKEIPEDVFYNSVVVPYAEKVMQRDDEFFLTESYVTSPVLAEFNIVDQLKGAWRTLDDRNKEIVWNYMQILLIISNKIRK